MGGLFSSDNRSSNNEGTVTHPNLPVTYPREPRPQVWPEYNSPEYLKRVYLAGVQPRNVSNIRRNQTAPPKPPNIKIVQYNPSLIEDLHLSLTDMDFRYSNRNIYELEQWDPKYFEIKSQIENVKHHRNCVLQFSWLELHRVYKVNNPYLKMLYELKKKEQLRTMKNTRELNLYHGTARKNVDSICEKNFDYRLCKRGRFGKGVSFSKQITYSLSYCKQKDDLKCIILCKVLFSKANVGDGNTIYPDYNCDTTIRDNGAVTVKYDDDVFYPEYIILFKTYK
ncbi:PREDICTED: poly [ADP-ribose] polymerase 12-like [Nicrophorus vespilloides]|uniref:Poly [ADP-ribose] polymerase n=1 Tax=Nicrophorus vespilloides TaxID=110193 RepID=A0ABM1M5J0_NICVS|nr:PREDICTED: poly [ADP-ribose] polymerase 12-like [Nicrophorus vespilloides]